MASADLDPYRDTIRNALDDTQELTALSAARLLAETIQDCGKRLGDLVFELRRQGQTWTQVGDATGLTKQGAQQRWG